MKKANYAWLPAAVLAALPLTTHASGFAITEQSASGLGSAYAGGAAEAADASTIFYNPAGMARLSGRQVTVSSQLIKPYAQFSNVSAGNPAGPAGGGNGGDAGSTTPIPDFYYVADAGRGLKYGFSITAPYGLKSEYDPAWAGRYYAIKSQLSAIDLSPSLAGKFNDKTSWGAALDIERGHADLSRAIDFGSLLGVAPHQMDGTTELTGNNWAYGYHLGFLHELSPTTRIGFTYRSKVTHQIDGTATFNNVPAVNVPPGIPLTSLYHTTGAHATITMPETVSFSAVHEFSPAWTVMGDATWTRWNRFHDLTVTMDGNPQPDSTLENWKNTWRFSLGAKYQASPKLALRGGAAYDQGPVPDATRSPVLPDGSRRWVTIGANYKVTAKDTIDAGYAHAFMSDSSVNLSDPKKGTLQGTVSSHADILGVQFNHAF